MNRNNIAIGFLGFILLSLSWGCSEAEIKEEPVSVPEKVLCKETNMILQPEALLQKMEEKAPLFIIEVSKEEDFEEGHLPAAQRIWRPDYEDTKNYPYTGMRADSQQVAQLLRNLGYNQGIPLVLYDRRGDVDAARFHWILRSFGHDEVSLLNGGIDAWKAKGYPLAQGTETPAVGGNFRFPIEKVLFQAIEMRDVQQALGDESYIILDTRTLDEYEGREQKKGAFLPGKIPGSIHLDWIECVNYNGDYTFKSCEEIEKLLAKRGISQDKKIITYCHSGVRSAHTAFVLSEIMGYPHVANYDGSWTEWSYFEAFPVTSDKTKIINN